MCIEREILNAPSSMVNANEMENLSISKAVLKT